MQDGYYHITVRTTDGREYVYRFLLATNLYARPRHVREVLGDLIKDFTDLDIGLALWVATQQVQEEMEALDIDPDDRKLARQRYTTYLAAVQLLQRRLVELSSQPIEEERRLGDSSVSIARHFGVLNDVLNKLKAELERWRSALKGGTKILGAERGGTINPYPLNSRVWV